MEEKISFIVSDESINSYGFRVLTSGIQTKNFKTNPVGFYNHHRSNSWDGDAMKSMPIIRWENLKKENNTLTAVPIFDENDELGAKAKSKVENGFLNATSIGIYILATSTDPKLMLKGQTRPTVTKCELYEISVVDIPSNSNATRLSDNGNKDIVILSNGKPVDNLDEILPIVELKEETTEKLQNPKTMEKDTKNSFLKTLGSIFVSAADGDKQKAEEQTAVLQSQLDKAEQETAQLKATIKKMKEENEQLKKDFASKETELADKAKEVETKATELDDTKLSLEEKMTALSAKFTAFETKHEELKAELKAKNEEIETLKTEKAEESAKVAEKEKEVETLTAEKKASDEKLAAQIEHTNNIIKDNKLNAELSTQESENQIETTSTNEEKENLNGSDLAWSLLGELRAEQEEAVA